MKEPKILHSFRLKPETIEVIRTTANELNCSQVSIVEQALEKHLKVLNHEKLMMPPSG